jgi:hypothetical protein
LTAPNLTDLNRLAEDTYQSTHSMDQALLALVRGFDTTARSKYAPLVYLTATPGTVNSPQQTSGVSGLAGLWSVCGQPCLFILLILFLLWLASKGIIIIPSGMGGGGFGSGGGWGGGGGGSISRGGSGSGRSGRGN